MHVRMTSPEGEQTVVATNFPYEAAIAVLDKTVDRFFGSKIDRYYHTLMSAHLGWTMAVLAGDPDLDK